MTDLTGHQVHLITGGDCNENIGVINAGRFEDTHVRGRAIDGLEIEPLLQA